MDSSTVTMPDVGWRHVEPRWGAPGLDRVAAGVLSAAGSPARVPRVDNPMGGLSVGSRSRLWCVRVRMAWGGGARVIRVMVGYGLWVGVFRGWCRSRGWVVTGVLALILGCGGPLLAARAGASAVTPRVLPAWETDGVVESVLLAGDRVCIGGHFGYVGPYTGSGARLNRATGLPVRRMAKLNGTVRIVVSYGAGGYYVGGDFTKVGALARAHIAHIRADGRVDRAWNPHANGVVSALAVAGSTVYVGGNFTSVGGQARNNLAGLNIRTGAASAFDPNPTLGRDAEEATTNGSVRALVVSGSTMYVGGNLTSVGGQARDNLAAIDARTGVVAAWDPKARGGLGGIRALAVSGSTVYAGGAFSSLGGKVHNLAAFDARNGAVTAWNPNPDNEVNAVAVSDATVYAGGYFRSVGGQPPTISLSPLASPPPSPP